MRLEKSMPHKFSAFSLIEVAIVLIVMGLIGGIAFPMVKGILDWQKTTTTAQNQEKILYALAGYATQHKTLPYAADPRDQRGKQEPRRRRGIVPYADLGLPESIAKDGYHHWFTYVVDDYYTIIPKTVTSGPLSQQPINRLCEKKVQSGDPLTIKGMQGDIALALISHGPQGRGAYPNPLAIPPQGEDETQNATSGTQIIDRPFSQDPSSPFSHKVVWITAKNLMAFYAHAPCPPVENAKLYGEHYQPITGKTPEPGGLRYQPLIPTTTGKTPQGGVVWK